jgi:hypothetical protein
MTPRSHRRTRGRSGLRRSAHAPGLAVRSRGASLRAVALGLSVAMVVVILAVVAYIVIRHQEAPPAASDADDLAVDVTAEPIDLAEATPAGADPEDLIGPLEGVAWITQDENGDIAQEFAWATMDPLPSGRYRLTEPEARLYLERGETVYVRADLGNVVKPVTSRTPEMGRFEGNVIIRIYDGHFRGDVSELTPKLSLSTDHMDFDATVGRIQTDAEVIVDSDALRFEGVGLDLTYNAIASRIERLIVYEGRRLIYDPAAPSPTDAPETPAASSPGATPPRTAATAPPRSSTRPAPAATGSARASESREVAAASTQDESPTGTTSAVVPPEEEPRRDYYRVTFDDDVEVRQGEQAIRAPHMMTLLLMEDGRVPLEGMDGIAPAASVTPSAGTTWRPTLTDWLVAHVVAQAEPSSAPRSGEPVNISWRGRLEVNPLGGPPAELAEDAAYVRFDGGAVHIVDEREENEATCAVAEYFAGRRLIRLEGDSIQRLRMAMSDGSLIESKQFELRLDTGAGRFIGRGHAVRPGDDDGGAGVRVDWRDRVLVRFHQTTDGGLGDLREAICEGDVRIEHESFEYRSDWFRVILSRDDPGLIESIDGQGAVFALVYDQGELQCDDLHAEMTAGSTGDVTPTIITARGNVDGRMTNGSRVLTDLLEVALRETSDDAGETILALDRFEAMRDGERLVTLEDGAGGVATVDRAVAGPDAKLVTLYGRPATVTRDAAVISSNELRLDNEAQILVAPGPGRFEYAGTEEEPRRLDVAWQRRMLYDGRAGHVHCEGAVTGRLEPAANEVNRFAGDDVQVQFATEEARGEGDAPQLDRVLSLEFEGNAEVEYRSYAEPSRASLERLINIRGERIVYLNDEQRLRVPGAGTMVLADLVAYLAEPTEASTDPTGRSMGSTYFQWQGEMELDAPDGIAHLRRGVSMRHREHQDADLLQLDCQDLTAYTMPVDLDDANAGGAQDVQLIRALARQAVYVATGDRMMLADELSYDALDSILVARANEGNVVTAYREGDLAEQKVDWVEWDIANDRFEAHGLRPVRVMRGR